MLQNIRKNICANSGGLVTLWFIPVEDTVSIPDPIYHIVADPVTLGSGKAFFSIDITEDTFNFSEKEVKTDDGKTFEVNISGFIAGDTNLMVDGFDDMSDRRHIVIAKDSNGYSRIVGTIGNGLFFKHDFDTQTSSNGRKGTQITFYGTFDFRQYFYQSTFDEVTSEGIVRVVSDAEVILAEISTAFEFWPDGKIKSMLWKSQDGLVEKKILDNNGELQNE
jgi:hypothetical protein